MKLLVINPNTTAERTAGLKPNWAIYRTCSGFHLFANSAARTLQPDQFDQTQIPIDELTTHDKAMPAMPGGGQYVRRGQSGKM